ncbi:hypothetical protein [Pseudocnuella soli]|uniref:hypothetical protein n=1 Tax=Pseudocnuella soli TaxID=2502779 RepID=UPI00105072E7|nr:hypothetical protein [Pseudocnuella soli]
MAFPNDRIPQHHSGVQTDTVSSQEFDTEAAAQQFYTQVQVRLLQVWRWQEWAGAGSASFALTDSAGAEVEREPQPGDYFKIDIPGPGPQTGDGYDWVRVEAVEKEDDCTIIRVRPASSPLNEHADVAHFFSDEATSNFIVRRVGNTVSAEVHGRNEKPNFGAEKIVEKARNTAVATGAVTAFSKLQWKSLVNGLVER